MKDLKIKVNENNENYPDEPFWDEKVEFSFIRKTKEKWSCYSVWRD